MDDLTNEQKRLLVSMYQEVLSRQPALSMIKQISLKILINLSNFFRLICLPNMSLNYVGN